MARVASIAAVCLTVALLTATVVLRLQDQSDARLRPPDERVETRRTFRPALSLVPSVAEEGQTFELSVRPGDSLLVGSLDQSCRVHPVEINFHWDADSERAASLSGPGRSSIADTRPSMMTDTVHRFRDLSHVRLAGVPQSAVPTENHVYCATDFSQNSTTLPVEGITRRFRVPLFTDTVTYDRFIAADLVRSSGRISVYAETTQSSADPVCEQLVLTQVCHLAENRILDYVTQRIGPVADLDGDGRLTIVVTTLTDGRPAETTSVPITGCVRGSDFLAEADPFGGDIVYLDRSIGCHDDVAAILAHEIAHAAVFSAVLRSSVQDVDSSREIPGWLNEAIAHVVELEVSPHSSNLQKRFSQFRRTSAHTPVVLTGTMRTSAASRGASRAAGCSFLATVLENSRPASIRDLLRESGQGIPGLENVTGRSFSEMFEEWMLALHAHRITEARPAQSGVFEIVGTGTMRFCEAPSSGIVVIHAPPESRLKVALVETSRAARDSRLTRKPDAQPK